MYGRQDLDFLERVFQNLLLNFPWVNRKDCDGKNIFEGGSLGPLPAGGVLEQKQTARVR
jgi:hypothetical protein